MHEQSLQTLTDHQTHHQANCSSFTTGFQAELELEEVTKACRLSLLRVFKFKFKVCSVQLYWLGFGFVMMGLDSHQLKTQASVGMSSLSANASTSCPISALFASGQQKLFQRK